MKTSTRCVLALLTLLATSQTPAVLGQNGDAPKTPTMGRVESVKLTASGLVTDIDQSTREVTLRGADGYEFSLVAGPAIKRLNEVKVGDRIQVTYLISAAAEVRPPTAEEAKHPLSVTEVTARTGKEKTPAGGVARQFKVVTTIEALDRRNDTVTVKGPRGRYLTAKVEDPKRLTQVRLGDTIVIVYSEALALALEKAK